LTLPILIDILPTSAIPVDFVNYCYSSFVEQREGLPLPCGNDPALLFFV
jgi:hypothetical protein